MRATHLKRTARRVTRTGGGLPRARGPRPAPSFPRALSNRVAPASNDARDQAEDDDAAVPERLLACTTEILSEQGVAFVSLRAVARRAGVSHGAPAYHFRSKAGLLAAYAATGFRELTKRLAAAIERAPHDPRARLSALGKAYVRFALRNPQQFEIMFRREMHGTGSKGLEDASARCSAVLASAVSDAVREGLLPAEQADRAVAASWSIAHGLAHLILEGRLPSRIRTRDPLLLAEGTLDLFVDAILRGGAGWRG
jgi:AcrR family transcriptional regulator